MKSVIISVVFVTLIVWVCQAQTLPVALKHEPNGGYINDASAAKDIAKVVLNRLLTPDNFQREEFSDAVLKDGVWTVRCWEEKDRINFPLVIEIRQQSGAIIRYEDPNG